MSDMCTDNRFELIEKYKKELVEATNIETSPEEMAVLDDILFRFWQMGWLDSIDRMLLVKESAKTLMHSVGDSIHAKALRNAGRFIQNAIDGKAPEFEKIPFVELECKKWNQLSEVDNEAMELAFKALEKQIPKSFTLQQDEDIKHMYRLYCPTCDAPLGKFNERNGHYMMFDPYAKCCSQCGQRLSNTIDEVE